MPAHVTTSKLLVLGAILVLLLALFHQRNAAPWLTFLRKFCELCPASAVRTETPPPEHHSLKIFKYEIPNYLRYYGFKQQDCLQDMYYVESLFPRLLERSEFCISETSLLASSNEVEKVDEYVNMVAPAYFYVEAYPTCHYHHCISTRGKHGDDQDAAEHCKASTSDYLSRILSYITTRYTFWNTSQGLDHLFVFTWDQGSEVLGWNSDIRKLVNTATHITSLGMSIPHPNFGTNKDVVVPTYNKDLAQVIDAMEVFEKFHDVSSLQNDTLITKFNVTQDKDIIAFFRGTIHTDTAYSHGVRQYLLKNPTPMIQVHTSHSSNYWNELARSVFALCPGGWSPWSPRLFDAIGVGSIPVIYADGTELPFEDIIDYRKFAIKIMNKDVPLTETILKKVMNNTTGLEQRRRYMRSIRRKLVWNRDRHLDGDAFDTTMLMLWKKRRRRRIGMLSWYE